MNEPAIGVPPGDAIALTRALVRVDSRNPGLVSGAPGEAAAARLLAGVLREWGFRVEIQESAPGRPNVLARIGAPGRTLMLNGHLDTVGVEGMLHAPFAAEVRDGRIWGRGACDMKAGVAAMCAAAWRAARDGALRGELLVTAVTDEEHDSLGTRALVASGVRADAAIVTEPTRLAVVPAHRGFAWIELTVHGRAAHGSRYDLGVDAIRHAGLLLAELDRLEADELPRRTHPLLGRASLHASTIAGGVGWSTYPERCVLRVERRLLPGETGATALREMEDAIARARTRQPGLRAQAALLTTQGPSDVAVDAPVVRALSAALAEQGEPVQVEGLAAWTDAALLNEAGIPAVCFGPGDIALAHAAEEWVAIDEIERATAVLTRLVRRWSEDGDGAWHN
ncbi:MAG TPA: ArgE/DapE family deacylase [Gemmatimonadaceae bacterium]|nr:ArgE/DapE family deacylase [Gemmatimonadaceae bacterium]